MGKKIGIVVGVLVILVAAGIYFVSSNLDRIVKQVIETQGSEATGTRVALGGVDLDLLAGEAALANLSVANPKGFKSDTAFSLAKITVALDTQSISKDVIVIKEIVIDQPVVTYELGEGGSNLDQIKANVSKGGSASSEEAGEYSGPKFIIETLRFTGGTVNVSADGVLNEDMASDLAGFTLRDIGKAAGGATPDEIAMEVTKALTQASLKAVTDKGVKNLLDKALDGAGDVGSKIKGLFDKKED
jgi:uncharacterized protein involved in outer membrane biogenesis